MSETDLRQAMSRLEVHKAQLEDLVRQRESVRLTLEEYLRAQETMRQYKKSGDGSEMLVPVGANSFLFAKVSSPDKALVGIGSNVVLEDSTEAAVDRLQRRIDSLTSASEEIARIVRETEGQIQTLSQQVQDEYTKLQAHQEGQG